MKLKKTVALFLMGALLVGCSSGGGTTPAPAASSAPAEASATAEAAASEAASEAAEAPAENIALDSLKIQFVPSRPAEEIVEQTSALPQLIIDEMKNHGYDIGEVTIDVSSSFEAAGEALSAGSIDLAWGMSGGTYVVYSDDVDVILTATRAGLSNDSTTPADWNGLENKTLRNGPQVTYYKALIYAGPSEKGQALAEKANNGEEITWEELNDATWCVASSVTSNAGYSFPTKWLIDNYGKKISDLANVTQDNYAGAFMKAAAEQVDIICCYADGRTDYEEDWNTPSDQTTSKGAGFGREKEIWEELNVIGVTDNIYNDTVSITKANPEVYNEQFINAFCDAMDAICQTQEGKDVIAIYTHEGYQRATDADYDGLRQALEAVQE